MANKKRITKEQKYWLDRAVNEARPLLDAVALMEDQAKSMIFDMAGCLVDAQNFTERQFWPIVNLAYAKGLRAARRRVEEVLDEVGLEEERLEIEHEER